MPRQSKKQERLTTLFSLIGGGNIDFEDSFATRIEYCAKFHTEQTHKGDGQQEPALPSELPLLGAYLAYKSSKRLEQVQQAQARSSKTFAKWSVALIVASVLASIATSAAVIFFSFGWQAKQTPLLQELVTNTKPSEPAKHPAQHTALLQKLVDNTKPAEPPKHPAEHTALLQKLVDNTKPAEPAKHATLHTALLQRIVDNTKPSEPAKHPAEHTALLQKLVENTRPTTQPAGR